MALDMFNLSAPPTDTHTAMVQDASSPASPPHAAGTTITKAKNLERLTILMLISLGLLAGVVNSNRSYQPIFKVFNLRVDSFILL